MKKKLNHGATKRKTINVTEDKKPENTENIPVKATSCDEEDQGFGGWLTSPDGLDTMKLFVIANSIVMLTTVVYPHIQNVYGILTDMFYVGVLVWYSVNVWNMITDYFNREFHKLISNETEYDDEVFI